MSKVSNYRLPFERDCQIETKLVNIASGQIEAEENNDKSRCYGVCTYNLRASRHMLVTPGAYSLKSPQLGIDFGDMLVIKIDRL